MPRKHIVVWPYRRPRIADSYTGADFKPTFYTRPHQERYTLLSTRMFGTLRTIDWEALQMIGIKAKVEQLQDIDAWHMLLSIDEPAYRDLTVKFLTYFERRLGCDVWDDPHTVRFQFRGQEYHLSYIELVLFMRIYTQEYTMTDEYHNLIFSPPLGESQFNRQRRLSDYGCPFKTSTTKSATLRSLALRVVHALLSGIITGHNHCTSNITITEFKYLLSMVDQTL